MNNPEYRVEYYSNGERLLTGLSSLDDALIFAKLLNGQVILDDSETYEVVL